MIHLDQLNSLVLRSNLPVFQKEELMGLFARATEGDVENMLELCTENPSLIDHISYNYNAKRDALLSRNPDLWDKILVTEVSQLEKIQSQN